MQALLSALVGLVLTVALLVGGLLAVVVTALVLSWLVDCLAALLAVRRRRGPAS